MLVDDTKTKKKLKRNCKGVNESTQCEGKKFSLNLSLRHELNVRSYTKEYITLYRA